MYYTLYNIILPKPSTSFPVSYNLWPVLSDVTCCVTAWSCHSNPNPSLKENKSKIKIKISKENKKSLSLLLLFLTSLNQEKLKIYSYILDLPTSIINLFMNTWILLFLLSISSRRMFSGILINSVIFQHSEKDVYFYSNSHILDLLS